eukprot:10519897-Karenia_brevis.AAC.1
MDAVTYVRQIKLTWDNATHMWSAPWQCPLLGRGPLGFQSNSTDQVIENLWKVLKEGSPQDLHRLDVREATTALRSSMQRVL